MGRFSCVQESNTDVTNTCTLRILVRAGYKAEHPKRINTLNGFEFSATAKTGSSL